MWNLQFQAPKIIEASIWSAVPDSFRVAQENQWAKINKPGQLIDSFLEGPVFDAKGNLYVTDIPYGRIFKISPDKNWELVIQYDGWPNGLAIDKEGQIWIADHKQGLLRLNPSTKLLETYNKYNRDYIRFNRLSMKCENGNKSEVYNAIDSLPINCINWTKNKTIIIDNWRMLHGRQIIIEKDYGKRCIERLQVFI